MHVSPRPPVQFEAIIIIKRDFYNTGQFPHIQALQRIYRRPTVTHFDAYTCTFTLQSGTLTNFSLLTFAALKTLRPLLHLSKYADSII